MKRLPRSPTQWSDEISRKSTLVTSCPCQRRKRAWKCVVMENWWYIILYILYIYMGTLPFTSLYEWIELHLHMYFIWTCMDKYFIYIYYHYYSYYYHRIGTIKFWQLYDCWSNSSLPKFPKNPFFPAASASRSPREPILTPGNHRCYGCWDVNRSETWKTNGKSSNIFHFILDFPIYTSIDREFPASHVWVLEAIFWDFW